MPEYAGVPVSVRSHSLYEMKKKKTFAFRKLSYRAFSLTWPASMLIFRTKESFYIRKEFNSHRIVWVHQHGRRSIVLEHQYGRRDVM